VTFKLDENLDLGTVALLGRAGHDVVTVRAEGLDGADDEDLFRVSVSEGRALITLDKDFLDTIRFPPRDTPGRVVLRPPKPLMSIALASRQPDLLARATSRDHRVLPGRFRFTAVGERRGVCLLLPKIYKPRCWERQAYFRSCGFGRCQGAFHQTMLQLWGEPGNYCPIAGFDEGMPPACGCRRAVRCWGARRRWSTACSPDRAQRGLAGAVERHSRADPARLPQPRASHPPLSFEMLARFRPSGILELTATPASGNPDNVLHSVSAGVEGGGHDQAADCARNRAGLAEGAGLRD
jgi:hypothetical protein